MQPNDHDSCVVYELGFNAYSLGKTLDDNPYRPDDPRYDIWFEGYNYGYRLRKFDFSTYQSDRVFDEFRVRS